MHHGAGHAGHGKSGKGASKRKRWPIFASVSVAGLLTVGHAIGGIAGLIEGYKHTVELLWPHRAEAHDTVAASEAQSPAPKMPSPFVQILGKVHTEFGHVKKALLNAEKADFSTLEKSFEVLKQLDENNPNVLYYAAEIARLKDTVDFTAHDCLVLGNRQTIEDAKLQHALFYAYLEKVGPLVVKFGEQDMYAKSCYADDSGFCRQRVAWVNHVLANDFFELATHTADRTRALGLFKRAAELAKLAKEYRVPGTNLVGFEQCVDSTTLQATAEAKLLDGHELQPKTVAVGSPY